MEARAPGPVHDMNQRSETTSRARDTGLAAVLLVLLVAWVWELPDLIPVAFGVLLLVMLWPRPFAPLARLWFGFSELIGTLMSRIVLSIVFFGIVTPIGLLRRLLGYDAMRRQAWKAGESSAFVVRNHRYSEEELERPY